MTSKGRKINCCNGQYHMLVDGNFYCMKPLDVVCSQACKDVGKFTGGQKKILYCLHHQHPCEKCNMLQSPPSKKSPGKEKRPSS